MHQFPISKAIIITARLKILESRIKSQFEINQINAITHLCINQSN